VCAYFFVSPLTVIIRILFETDAYKIKMVPQPQIYIARDNLKNLDGPLSILNIRPSISGSRIRREVEAHARRECLTVP
jgi:hypothetical protein